MSKNLISKKSFLQYLWGETTLFLTTIVIAYQFYSTYEELKQVTAVKVTAIEVSFYSTYEELKLFSVIPLSLHKFVFYSTYEELKLLQCSFS